MGFFGLYATTLKVIPGLPGIELAQLYVLLSFIKVLRNKSKPELFYKTWLGILLGYMIFLLVFGFANGLRNDVTVHFKVLKMTLPLLLFYTLPRLITKISDYKELFSFLFIVTFLGFVAQLITMFTGFVPQLYVNPVGDIDLEYEIEVGRNFRVLNNPGITLISLFGALYFLSAKGLKFFKKSYLYLIIICCFVTAFLSATRGWILSFGFVIFLSFFFVLQTQLKQIIAFVFLFGVFLIMGFSVKKINTQIHYSIDRMFTLNSLASGDITADGTLERLNERSPIVIHEWKKSPILGQGFSDKYFIFSDMHVGNQNILLHAGIIGFILIYGFLFYFMFTMMQAFKTLSFYNPFSLAFLLFIIFLIGWIFLHSTSSQQFAFYGLPNDIFPQAIFLSLAAFTYTFSKKINPVKGIYII